MEQTTRKAAFLDEVLRARKEYETALAQIPEDRMTEPGVVGDWSAKDLIAHVTWSEREMVAVLRDRVFQGSDLWLLDQDERNARVYEENCDRDLADVRAEADRIYSELVRLVEGLTDDELNDARYFEGMPADWAPWDVLRGNTYKHYREHAEGLREWLGRGRAPENPA